MSNQIEQKWSTLRDMLANNGLVKIAGDQTIKHMTPEDQKSIGKDDQEIVKEEIKGTVASTPAAEIKHTDDVQTPPNCQNLNKDPQAALSSTGTKVEVMDQTGDSTPLPKSAADYRKQLAQILHKQAALQKQAAEQPAQAKPEDFRTATEVMQKFAALGNQPTDQALAECRDELMKLASTNPMFSVVRDDILMRKMAEEIDELAAAQGISPDEAAAALDEAAAANPEMGAELEDEANGEAVAELADAEAGAADLMDGAQQLADNASAVLGEEVTAEDMLDAIDQVEAAAEEMGVPPEALIQAAMEQMQGGGEGEDVSPEEEAEAQQILDAAAEQGVSPEEVVQMAADMMGEGGEAAPEEAPTEAPAEGGEEKEEPEEKEEDSEKKEASFQFKSPRAAYVSSLISQARK